VRVGAYMCAHVGGVRVGAYMCAHVGGVRRGAHVGGVRRGAHMVGGAFFRKFQKRGDLIEKGPQGEIPKTK